MIHQVPSLECVCGGENECVIPREIKFIFVHEF